MVDIVVPATTKVDTPTIIFSSYEKILVFPEIIRCIL